MSQFNQNVDSQMKSQRFGSNGIDFQDFNNNYGSEEDSDNSEEEQTELW